MFLYYDEKLIEFSLNLANIHQHATETKQMVVYFNYTEAMKMNHTLVLKRVDGYFLCLYVTEARNRTVKLYDMLSKSDIPK